MPKLGPLPNESKIQAVERKVTKNTAAKARRDIAVIRCNIFIEITGIQNIPYFSVDNARVKIRRK
jgi:hypothetical protein